MVCSDSLLLCLLCCVVLGVGRGAAERHLARLMKDARLECDEHAPLHERAARTPAAS